MFFRNFSLITALLLFILVICSCQTSPKEDFPTIYLNPNQSEIQCALSEIISEVKAVRLETKAESLVDQLSYLSYADEKNIVYVSDKKVLIFDAQGKYVNKIDALGKGPGEYTTIINIHIDPEMKLIYVVDWEAIYVYDYEGKYINKIKISFKPGGIFRTKSGEFFASCSQIYAEHDRDMLYVLDTALNITYSFKSRNSDVCENIKQNLFFTGSPYEIDKSIFYKEPFVDTIYAIIDSVLKPHWCITAAKRRFETKDGISVANYRGASEDKIPPPSIRETKRYFFIEYSYQNAKHLSIYDKNNNKFRYNEKYEMDY